MALKKESLHLLNGSAKYIADVRADGMLHAAVLRSPHAHAKIKGIDCSGALRNPKVKAIILGSEVPELTKPMPMVTRMPNLKQTLYYAAAVDKARFVGEPVLALAADDAPAAEDALEAINVDYEPLEPVTSVENSINPGSPVLHENLGTNVVMQQVISSGNVEEAFGKADLVLERQFKIGRISGSALESGGYLASFDRTSGKLTVCYPTQTPHMDRSELSNVLDLPENRIRIVVPQVGGAFGNRMDVDPELVLTCLLSMKTNRPVRWIASRRDYFVGTVHSRQQKHIVKVALKKDGEILGIKDKILFDLGAYLEARTMGPPAITARMLPGPYKIRNVHIESLGILTNKTPSGAYRGYGHPEANFVIERIIDIIARELNADPIKVRLKNLLKADSLPYQTATGLILDSGDYSECLATAARLCDYSKLREEQKHAKNTNERIGIGVAVYVEATGDGFVYNPTRQQAGIWGSGGYESVTLRVEPDGTATILAVCPSIGTKLDVTLSEMCATELSISPDDVTVASINTEAIPYGIGLLASRGAIMAGTALLEASKQVKHKILCIAEHLTGVAASSLDLRGGMICKKSGESLLSLSEVAQSAYLATDQLPSTLEPGLHATVYQRFQGLRYSYGAHVAVVLVDKETGQVGLRNHYIVHDCGKELRPETVKEQVQGGLVQGIGEALSEHLEYDSEGQLLNGSFIDYLTPIATQIPEIKIIPFEGSDTQVVKGTGESGIIPALAAIANAVSDALYDEGVDALEIPLTPFRVWQLCRKALLSKLPRQDTP